MAKGSSEITATEEADRHHPSHWHLGQHLKHVVKADGRRVYIASNPVEADELRHKLSEQELDAELVLHGSDEHLTALREIHSFHLGRHAAFQEKHGEHFSELERAIRDMDAVQEQLHALEKRVIQLDAAAEKYGYDSHVRLREPGEHHPANGQSRDFEQERRNAKSMSFYNKPVLRQYYHKGLLWRANEIHEASSYELFVDLVYVGVVAMAGDSAAVEANGHSLLRFAVTFLMGWKFWKELGTYSALFVQEDIQRRLSVLIVLVCLVGATVNMEGFFDNTYTALVAFYVTAEFISAFSWLFYASLLPKVRLVLISNAALLFMSIPLWIGSIHDHSSSRYALIWIALFLDIIGYELKWLLGMQARKRRKHDHPTSSWVSKRLEYVPAMSVEHLVSRLDAFVTLVLGYSVVSLLYQSATHNPLNNFFTKAILGLLQAFALNSLYFEMDTFNLYTHAIRRHNWYFVFVWIIVHIPLVMSLVVAGATISRLVLAHDCNHCPVSALAEPYATRSQPSILPGQRWFYCAGLGLATICTAIIASTHHYRRPDTGTWFFQHRKNLRLVLRAVVGLVIVLLPVFAGERLDSVGLIATTTGLLHLCLFTDLAGNVLDARFCRGKKREVEEEEEGDDGSHVVRVP
jgi:low temperature requirement protein LtrA